MPNGNTERTSCPGRRRQVVVATHEPPGYDPNVTMGALTVSLLDEQDLALDGDEVQRVADATRSEVTPVDGSAFGDRTRGCPWKVGWEPLRQSSGGPGRAWVTPDIVFYRALRESEGFLGSEIGCVPNSVVASYPSTRTLGIRKGDIVRLVQVRKVCAVHHSVWSI